jgi:hypothetical protein
MINSGLALISGPPQRSGGMALRIRKTVDRVMIPWSITVIIALVNLTECEIRSVPFGGRMGRVEEWNRTTDLLPPRQ